MTEQRVDAPTSTRPALLRASVVVYIVAAVVNLAVGAWTLSAVPKVVETMTAKGQNASGVVPAVVVIGVATLLFSAALVVLAVRLRAGWSWARPAILTVSVLSLVTLVSGGGPGLAVVLILICAAILVTRAPVSAWLRRIRGLPAA